MTFDSQSRPGFQYQERDIDGKVYSCLRVGQRLSQVGHGLGELEAVLGAHARRALANEVIAELTIAPFLRQT